MDVGMASFPGLQLPSVVLNALAVLKSDALLWSVVRTGRPNLV